LENWVEMHPKIKLEKMGIIGNKIIINIIN
jgi:hypothetical protein